MPIFCLMAAPDASLSVAIAGAAPVALRRHEKVVPSQSLEDTCVPWSDASVYERRIREVMVKHIARAALALAALALAASIAFFPIGTAMAQSCESKAVSAEGKPLHGAAKNSFMAKCKRDA
jgi:hypothetical protein